MAHLRLITLCSLLLSVALAQQYSGNYVESDYDYDQPPPSPRPAQAPRSFSRPSPPASPPLRSLGSSSSSSVRATPVPILKQINRHNEDGSYTYGYEGADGSFKIETKLTNGEVMGKYGYVDDVGKVRVVEYGANKFGFMPSGEGITVAPPTLVDETRKGDVPDYDDGQYYEQPPQRAPVSSPRFSSNPAPPPPRPAPRPAPAPAPARPAPPPPSASRGYETYETETDYAAPPPPRPSNVGPAPPRLQVPGAAPSGGSNTGIVYSPSQRPPRPQSFSAPSPPRQNPSAPAPSPAFRPQSSFSAPSRPQSSFSAPSRPQPSFSAPSRPQARQAGGILDQLAKDYALPPGGQPLHDITFGYY